MNSPTTSDNPLSVANILTCATAARLAYTMPNLHDPSGESAFIQDSGDSLIIAFPGTHDLSDVLRDLDCLRAPAEILGRPCSVHAGFAHSWNALEPLVFSYAQLRDLRVKKLFITGHSKGAAVAKRCALALSEQNIPVTSVITFGEPRGGDARYARLYHDALGDRTLRVTNAADPVPWLPAWLAGNRHCGPEAYLPPGDSPELVLGPRLWWKLLLNAREIYQAWQLKTLIPLTDHHIDNYLRRLNSL